jgi:hypothetical protein
MKNKIKTTCLPKLFSRQVSAFIVLSAIMLSASAFAGENDGKDKKGTTSNASEYGMKSTAYVWANCPILGSCSKTGGANAGPDKIWSTGGCCVPPTIGGSPCAIGTHSCAPCQIAYSWAPATGLSSTTNCQPTATPGSTTNYTLTVTFTCGHISNCPGGSTPYDCCLDACDGLNKTCLGPTYCSGSPSITDVVKVTVNGNACCRLVNPTQLPEVNDENINVYPNPNPGVFTLEVEKVKDNMTIHVYNIQGESVWGEVNISDKQIIDISALSKGIYFIRIKTGEDVSLYKKIIVQ